MTHSDRIQRLLDLSAGRLRTHKSAIADTLAAALEDVVVPDKWVPPNTALDHPSGMTLLGSGAKDDLVDDISKSLTLLAWRLPGFGKLSSELSKHMAVVELVGPAGQIHHDTIRFGFLFQGANIQYPTHHHPAEEIYLILSGYAHWEVDRQSLGVLRAGQLMHHLPMQTHAMQTHDQPMLTMWGWIGDIASNQYRIDEHA